jgi:hypothetical protein
VTVYDEAAGAMLLAASFVAIFLPMAAIWLAIVNRRVRDREAALQSARQRAEQDLTATRTRLSIIEEHAAISALERKAIVDMARIITDGNRRSYS